MNLIVLAIPVFILLILLELVITRIQEKDYYRLSDSINDLSCGILQQILEAFLKTVLFGVPRNAGLAEPLPPCFREAGGTRHGID